MHAAIIRAGFLQNMYLHTDQNRNLDIITKYTEQEKRGIGQATMALHKANLKSRCSLVLENLQVLIISYSVGSSIFVSPIYFFLTTQYLILFSRNLIVVTGPNGNFTHTISQLEMQPKR